jgi:predicted cupin superfamily sugar epimerase
MSTRADDIIRTLGLEPHPEGGCYREFFRSVEQVTPADGRGARAALSAIYFMLRAGGSSRWHAVRSDEQWTYLEGDPLELFVIDRATFRPVTHRLGGPAGGGTATVVVPAGAWQAASPTGSHTLVTCVVGPGFDFDDFEFMGDNPEATERLRREFPALTRFL